MFPLLISPQFVRQITRHDLHIFMAESFFLYIMASGGLYSTIYINNYYGRELTCSERSRRVLVAEWVRASALSHSEWLFPSG